VVSFLYSIPSFSHYSSTRHAYRILLVLLLGFACLLIEATYFILFSQAINEPLPTKQVPPLGIYEKYTPPDPSESVVPVFSKPDAPWPVDYWGRSRGFHSQWDDPGSTENSPGVEGDGSRTFTNPKDYPFEEVDLEAFAEQAFHNYTPYAVGMLPYAVEWHTMKLDAGLYQFKLGQWNDGSQKVNVRELKAKNLPRNQVGRGNPPLNASLRELERLDKKEEVIIVTKGGQVKAVFPIMQQETKPAVIGRFQRAFMRRNKRHPQWGEMGLIQTFKARIDETEGRPITLFDLEEETGVVHMTVCQRHLCHTAFVNAKDVFPYVPPQKQSPYQDLPLQTPPKPPANRWDVPSHFEKPLLD
jgi:hypothetical protein